MFKDNIDIIAKGNLHIYSLLYKKKEHKLQKYAIKYF